MKKLAVIGANEFQSRLIDKANTLGIDTHVFSWDRNEIGVSKASYFYLSDVTDVSYILDACKSIGVDGVCSVSSDLTNITVDYIKGELNLRKNTPEAIRYTTNKYEMRNKLKASNCPIPKFQLVSSFDDLTDINQFSLPIIVKPIDRSGSRGISKVLKVENLKKAIEYSQSVSFCDEVLIEEFIVGKEFSVEGFTLNSEHYLFQITEKFTTGSPNFIEVAHLAPARISTELEMKIRKVITNALDSLEIINGSSHSELKIDSCGNIKIIEIGSRMGGDFIGSDLVPHSSGVDYLQLEIKNALELPINKKELIVNKNNIVMSYFFFSECDVKRFESIQSLVNIIDYKINNKHNEKITNSSERLGYAIFKINKDNISDVIEKLEIEHDSF